VSLRIQIFFGGLASGSVYGLAALGLTFIYRVTGMLNFAQGMVVTLGGLTYAKLAIEGVPVLPAVLVSIGGAAVLSAAIGLGLARWFGPDHHMTGALLTLALAVVLQASASLYFGKDALAAPSLVEVPNLRVGGAVIRGDQLVIIACAALASIAFWAWLRWTRQGKVFTALVDDSFGAQVVGLRITRLRVAAFAVGGLLAGLAGVAITPANTMAYNSGDLLLLSSVTAAAVGGISKPLAAIVGGITVGMVESIVAGTIGSLWQITIPMGVLMLVLAVRPEGLLGAKHARTV
jgi:branched-chain amino acid transport system permease protein